MVRQGLTVLPTPYERARAVYDREPCVRSFEEDLHLHLLNGYVFSRPDFFIMGRAVNSRADPVRVVNPSWRFDPAGCDAWLVYLFAGDVRPAWSILPHKLPLIGFERDNELRFYSLERIAKVCMPAGTSL